METKAFVHFYHPAYRNGGEPLNVETKFNSVPHIAEFVAVKVDEWNLDEPLKGTQILEVIAVDHLGTGVNRQFDVELWCRYITVDEHNRRTVRLIVK